MRFLKRKKTKLFGLILAISLVFTSSYAETYYVKNGGNDNLDGTTPANAWGTIAKVNSSTFLPGDSILFSAGSDFRATLAVPSSGTSENYIYFGKYGAGNNPRILGSNISGSWTPSGTTNVWQSVGGFTNPHFDGARYSEIFFESLDGQDAYWGHWENSIGGLGNDLDWTFSGGVVYVYSNEDPDSRFGSVEIVQRRHAIELSDKNYIEVDGIDMLYLSTAGIRDTYPTSELYGLTIRNCNIGFLGVKDDPAAFGIYVWHSGTLIENNTIHDCGRRSISYFGTNAGAEITFGTSIIQDNTFYNGWHTTGIDCIVERGSDSSMDSLIIRRNKFLENPAIVRNMVDNPNSNHIFVADQSGSGLGTVSNVYIYNNIFTFAPGGGVLVENAVNVQVTHNTFYGFNPYLANFQNLIGFSGCGTSGLAYNNIMYHNGNPSDNINLNGLKMNECLQDNGAVDADYNLYYSDNPGARLFVFWPLEITGGGTPINHRTDNWSNLSTVYSFETNSPGISDPMFKNPPTDEFSLDINENELGVSSGSSAINAGTPISYVKTDFNGNPRDLLNPTIGAFEFIDPDSTLAYIKDFILEEQTGPAVIDTSAKTVNIEVKDGTNLTTLVPTVVTNLGATVNPVSGATVNLTTPQNYRVTASDGTTFNDYTVTVSVAPNRAPEAQNVLLVGFPYIDSTISVSYSYYDYEDNPEGTTLFEWFVNGVSAGVTTSYYTISSNDSSYSIYCEVTAVASTGNLTGTAVQSNTSEPVVPFSVKVEEAEIGNVSDSIVTVEFTTELLSSFVPSANDFTVTSNGTEIPVIAVNISDGILLLSLQSSGLWGQWFQLSYSRGSVIMRDAEGLEVLSFSDSVLTNNIPTHLYENYFLYSEQVENAVWTKPQNPVVTVNQNADLEGNVTLELLEHGPPGAYMIIIAQRINNLKPNTTYTIEFDVYSDDPKVGSTPWQFGISENNGRWKYQSWGQLVVASQLTRIKLEFTTSSNHDFITLRPIDNYSLNNDLHMGRFHLYEGRIGSKLYIETTDAQVINATGSGQAPVINIDFEQSMNRGFEYILDASNTSNGNIGSFSFNWEIPNEIPSTLTSTSQAKILPCELSKSKNYDVVLNVSDGINTVSKTIELNIEDYKPEAKKLSIKSITASSFQEGNAPQDIADNNLETRWSAEGDNEWISFELNYDSYLSHFDISFYRGEMRLANFDLYASTDNINWDIIRSNIYSCGFSDNYQTFAVPTEYNKLIKYVRFVGHMNSESAWNSVNEITVYGYNEQDEGGTKNDSFDVEKKIEIYPNPSRNLLNIRTNEEAIIRIISLTGKILYEQLSEGTITTLEHDFPNGIYIVQSLEDNVITGTERLIVK